MIIVLLMLTSTLAGCTGTGTSNLEEQIADLEESNDEMEDTISQKNNVISLLENYTEELTSDAEMERSSLLEQLEDSKTSSDELNSMIEEADNTIQQLNGDLLMQHNLVIEWILRAAYDDFSYANMSNVDLNNAD